MEAMSDSGLEECELRKSESVRLAMKESKTSRNAIPAGRGPLITFGSRRHSLLDPCQKHAGLALLVHDFHDRFRPAAFARRVGPDDLEFFMAVGALDHASLPA